MKKLLLLTTLVICASIKSFATNSGFALQGQVSDQCSITIGAVPSTSAIGAILAHIQSNSVISVPLEINCNQAGLQIKGQASYGAFNNSGSNFNIPYSMELIGPNITSAGIFQSSALTAEKVLGTTALGSPTGSQVKVYPQVQSSAVPIGNYIEIISLSVTSL